MKIVITGSLGHISRPLAINLVQNRHSVTVVSSDARKIEEIEALGAVAAIGSLEDADFLTRTYRGADAVYTMIPPNNYFDQSLDLPAWYKRIGNNYAKAVADSGVKRQVHLSSIGAHMQNGNGMLSNTWVVEQILNKLNTTELTFIRPTSFYYNLLGYIPGIKAAGVIKANYGTGGLVPWVSPIDIAAVVSEELTAGKGKDIRYVVSEELSGEDTARILGGAIGQPDLRWEYVSDEEALKELVEIGMNPEIAAGLVEMYAALQTGVLTEDYRRNRPETFGKVKLADFAVDFARAAKNWN